MINIISDIDNINGMVCHCLFAKMRIFFQIYMMCQSLKNICLSLMRERDVINNYIFNI